MNLGCRSILVISLSITLMDGTTSVGAAGGLEGLRQNGFTTMSLIDNLNLSKTLMPDSFSENSGLTNPSVPSQLGLQEGLGFERFGYAHGTDLIGKFSDKTRAGASGQGLVFTKAVSESVQGGNITEGFQQARHSIVKLFENLNVFSQQYGSGGLGLAPVMEAQGVPGTRFIPLLTISERYDSNVFFAPKLPGLKREDYVTSTSPQLFIQDSREFGSTTVNLGATAEYFVVNSGLSYVGFNGGIASNLSPLVQRYVYGATLRISEAYTYTPNPPGFLAGNQNYFGIISGDITDRLPVSDEYVRSLQAFRVNTRSNTVRLRGSIPLGATSDLHASYAYATTSFGNQFVQPQQNFRAILTDVSTHAATIGPTVRLSPVDSLFGTYAYTETTGQVVFSTHTASGGWVHSLSQALLSRISGGVSFLHQEGDTSRVTYTSGASISWVGGRTNATLAYNAGVFPSYITAGGALLTNSVSAAVSHQLTSELYGNVGGSYGRDVSIISSGSQRDLSFESVHAYARLNYLVMREAALGLNYSFSYNDGTFNAASPSERDTIVRHAVTLTLSKYWQMQL